LPEAVAWGAGGQGATPRPDSEYVECVWLGRWTCNQQVAGSTPGRGVAE